MDVPQILAGLEALGSEENRRGMARFGIATETAYGVSVNDLRKMAREIGRDHALAQELWDTGKHEARILATIVDVPKLVTGEQMERWVRDFDSWDLCDQCCGNLFCRTPLGHAKAVEWSEREPEFEKRAAFSLIAYLVVHDKKAPDEKFLPFLPIIERASSDDRNFVKKAVNWALRQVGKRSPALNAAAIDAAHRIQESGTRSGKWIAADALRELTSDAVQSRLHR